MHSKFIATVTAASIFITGFAAAPARANQEDVGRALAALLGVAIIGAVIHDSKKDKKAQARVHKQPRQQVHTPVKKKSKVKARPLPRRVSEHLLPGRCLRSFKTRRGDMTRMFGRQCLNQSYGFTNRLPQHCERRVRTNRGMRVGFGVRCLRNQGYKLARH